MSAGKVYVIQSGESYYYKIGLAKDPYSQRIKNLQTGNPYRLYLRKTHDVKDMRVAEDILHRRYFQLRGIGEWFLFDPNHWLTPARVEELYFYIDNQLDLDMRAFEQIQMLLKEDYT